MLKHAFESLEINELKSKEEEDACYQRLKEYVDHHNLILEFIEKLNKLYSVQMFNQFLGNTVSICMGIYIISATGSDISTQLRSSLITVTFILQLAIYCIGGTLLSQACLEIAESMYYSGWEGNNHKRFRTACYMIVMRSQKLQSLRAGGLFDISVITLTSGSSVGDEMYQSDWWVQNLPRIRHATLMVIMRSQRPQKLTAGGFFDINYETFAAIIKSSFSFFALLKSVVDNDEDA
ncbi:Odorant receptor 45b [Carabus blaptoides fortunei]